MHPNPIFRETDTITALTLASEIGFGTLSINGPETPLMAHVPFVIDGNCALLHLVRSNPIARAINSTTPAKIAVTGPHSYISPDWYGIEDQVPTWNYVAVHLEGVLSPLPANDLPHILEDLSEEFETRLLPKPVWKADKMDPVALQKMMRMILPYRFEITDVQSTFKLNQNKPDDVRLSAAEHLRDHGIGSETQRLANMMKTYSPKDRK